MKFTAVLLLTLMICCYSATASDLCSQIDNFIASYLLGTHDDYMKTIAPFATTDTMRKAASQLKKCALKVPLALREAKVKVMENIKEKCSEAQQVQQN